tara:strand:+ start:393 stop:542 length:150 start_codon:yes stop_codon:yes gene_type:complete
MAISNELLKVLACPVCKSDLTQNKNQLKCKKCNVNYPIKDDIPILIPKN